ncbi:leucine-rich repeat and guanylate kinase domain-containing protein isoform X5 [Monodelphis domestica]|uniref:leucine-rich repeat and guanylate kinase domain-containing protein isoform X5 n=1 Tax=Monodelphis domestica TaxID=13616 RepID=UPI0024E20DB5|nr:leucine-rich repeat and guanylate kinase domain-containing protein isoform X5 [Monodelphis domestica]
MSSVDLRNNRSSTVTNNFPVGQKLPSGYSSVSFFLQQLFHNDPSLRLGYSYEEEDEEDNAEAEEESSESEEEMVVVENEFDGVLREEAVAEALCKLGRSGPGTEQVYLHLSLPNADLIDVNILCGYVHLEKLELSHNKINELTCVSFMPYLIELSASHNELTTFFGFKPPKNLKKVDFSFNKIPEMNDLFRYKGLTRLILDHNEIKEIKGLTNCSALSHLSLAHNKITKMEGFGKLPIKILCLSNNQIEEISCLENLKILQNLDLSGNKISRLKGLENHDLLEIINLEDNKIAELSEIKHIENLPLLRVLNLLKNPLQDKSDYWLFVLYTLPRLTELDRKKINVEEKVEAENKYAPPPEVVAAQDHLKNIVYSMMQPQRIFDSTLPSLDAPYPMLVLVGPQAGGKRELAHRLCRQFSTFFRYGSCHTTRLPYFGEGDRVDYNFISEEVFAEMLNMGKFILTYKYNKHNYGLTRDTVEGIAREGLASCIHMDIEGVRSLKHSYFEPRYILLVPMNKVKYEGNLRRMGLFSRSEIEFSVARVDYYIEINQDFPGYFDALINTDDLNTAYQNLCQLIREYLGLSDQLGKDMSDITGPPSSRRTLNGLPSYLIPSPRRLTKLEKEGVLAKFPFGVENHEKVPENQNITPSQNHQITQEGETNSLEVPSNNQKASQHSNPDLSHVPQSAQDKKADNHPKSTELHDLALTDGAEVPKSDSNSNRNSPDKPVTHPTDSSENQLMPLQNEAKNVGSQETDQSSDAPPSHSPQQDQDEESGETKVPFTHSEPPKNSDSSPSSSQTAQNKEVNEDELPKEPEPNLPPNTQTIQNEEVGEVKLPHSSPSHSDSSPREPQVPLEEETHKTEVARVDTPYPEDLPKSQKQTQERDAPNSLLPPNKWAPTRLPQPRMLAPLQSRRPSPRSPNRESALEQMADQNITPSPRPQPSQEGEVKLPPISPLSSNPSPNMHLTPPDNSLKTQEEKDSEVKLPLISPPQPEPQLHHSPNLALEEEAHQIKLPHLPTPFSEPQQTQAHRQRKEKKVQQRELNSNKKITDKLANQESGQQVKAKKPSSLKRDTGKGPAQLKKRSLESRVHSEQNPTNPSPPKGSELNQEEETPASEVPEPSQSEPLIENDNQLQEVKIQKVPHSSKKVPAKLSKNELIPKVRVPKKGVIPKERES